MKLYVFQLDDKLRQNLLSRKYSLEKLEEIHQELAEQIEDRRRGFHRAAAAVTIICTLLLAMTYLSIGGGEVFWLTCAVVVCLGALALGAGWFSGIGLIRRQFRRTMEKAYPEYAQMLLL